MELMRSAFLNISHFHTARLMLNLQKDSDSRRNIEKKKIGENINILSSEETESMSEDVNLKCTFKPTLSILTMSTVLS